MKFDERFLDEIKGRLRLSDVIGRSVKLRRSGREYVGLSPFGKEKTPSFYVNDEKGFFHDFSSGKHGDLIGFLQETERLTFREAVERLAAEAGLALPAEDPRQAEVEQKRQGLLEWTELAAKWFEAQLKRPAGDAARDYLKRRALPEDQWARFRLGFAPSGRTGLKDYLIAKGARPAELIDAGLLIAPEDGGAPYDRFRDRIIFPITDGRGRVVSFGGRAMDPEARAKYLNGPETSLFHKGSLLYGLHEARRLLHAGERTGAVSPLVVVEGYMDVIACQRAEIAAAAPMGTALTEEQMDVLWRVHPEPTLYFDGDSAGKRAASRSIDRALPLLKPGRSFKFAQVAGGKDPDDVLRDHGPQALKAQVSNTRPFVQALFEREYEAEPLDTPERRASLKVRLRHVSGMIADKDLAEFYRSELIDLFYSALRKPRFSSAGSKFDYLASVRSSSPSTVKGLLEHRIRCFNAAISYGAYEHPEWLAPHDERFHLVGFGDSRLAPLVQPFMDAFYDQIYTTEVVKINIESDGAEAKNALEYAYRFATDDDVFPFVGNKSPYEMAKFYWDASFEILLKLAEFEEEASERKRDFHARAPVRGDPKFFISRGMVITRERKALFNQIHEGSVWGKGV